MDTDDVIDTAELVEAAPAPATGTTPEPAVDPAEDLARVEQLEAELARIEGELTALDEAH